MTDNIAQNVRDTFRARHEAAPAFVVRAPGRVNLIGDHTDYNDGFVLPMAIDRTITIALTPRDDRRVLIHSLDFDEPIDFDLDDIQRAENSPAEYVKGVAWALGLAGYPLTGWTGVMQGDIPIGAGLSSSAALELAVARAFAAVSGFAWDAVRMALIAQQAENEWVGMKCGIMDQLISATGESGHAVMIDCRTLALSPAPLPPGTAVVVLDTNTRRGLVDSQYNVRREQCEAAAQFFGVEKLRDVTPEQIAEQPAGLDDVVYRRARHIVTENQRVLDAHEAMRSGDADTVGDLMNLSHASLRDDFEVSADGLNIIVRSAQAAIGCYGARMTGAGFGGCACALVVAEAVEAFCAEVSAAYFAQTDIQPSLYVCQPSDGAQVLSASASS